MVFHHAMAMVHMVEPEFPEAILDIVESERMEVRFCDSVKRHHQSVLA